MKYELKTDSWNKGCTLKKPYLECSLKAIVEQFYQQPPSWGQSLNINKKLKKSGLAGIFAASLELTKQGATNIMQKKIFGKLLIKKIT